MQIERLLLDHNGQTEEALKHIYTVLSINEHIEISIDCETSMAKEPDESADSEELPEDRQPGAPTIVSIVPLAEQQDRAAQAAERQGGDFDPLSSPRKQGAPTEQGDDDQLDG